MGDAWSVVSATNRGNVWTKPRALPGFEAVAAASAPLLLANGTRSVVLVTMDRSAAALVASTYARARWSRTHRLKLVRRPLSPLTHATVGRRVVVSWIDGRGVQTTNFADGRWDGVRTVAGTGDDVVASEGVQVAIDRNNRPVFAWQQRDREGRRHAHVAFARTPKAEYRFELRHYKKRWLGERAVIRLIHDALRRTVVAVVTGGARRERRSAVISSKDKTPVPYAEVTVTDYPSTYSWDGKRWTGLSASQGDRYSRCCWGGPDEPAQTIAHWMPPATATRSGPPGAARRFRVRKDGPSSKWIDDR